MIWRINRIVRDWCAWLCSAHPNVSQDAWL